MLVDRVFKNNPCHRFPLLHAFTSKDMLIAVQHILFVRRLGWSRSALLPTIDAVWSSPRHGDRSLHNSLPTSLPQLSVAKMGFAISGADQPRSRQSLHAHVRCADYGWFWPKSQESRPRQKLDSSSVL